MTATIRVEGKAAEPRASVSQSGKSMLDISVAHNPRERDPQTGQWSNLKDRKTGEDIVLWVNARYFEEKADALATQISRGMVIELEGEPIIKPFTRENGEPGYRLDLRNPKTPRIIPPTKLQQSAGQYSERSSNDPWSNAPAGQDGWNQ